MEQLSAIDASWFQMDEPGNAADITVLLEFSEPVPRPDIEALLEQLVERYPRFRQRVRQNARTLQWEDDPDFDLEHHLREAQLDEEEGDLQAFIGRLATRPLAADRSPWEMTLVHDPERGGALVMRIHHCMGDGFGLGAAFLRLFENKEEPPEQGDDDATDHPSLRDRLVHEAHVLREHPEHALELVEAASGLARSLGKLLMMPFDPTTFLHGELSGERRVAWTHSVPLDRVKRIGHGLGATLNDTLIAALSGALRQLLSERGGEDVPAIRAMVPVNLRAARRLEDVSDDLGNMFGLVILDLFTSEERPHERLHKLKSAMDDLKQSADALVSFGILAAVGKTPAWIEHLVTHVFARKASVVITNVPGPRHALSLRDNHIENVVFWVPHPGLFGVGLSIISYNGYIRVGVRSDAAVIPDPQRLAELFELELEALEQAEAN